MAYSAIGIVNLAMARIGEGAISSLTGTDAKSILAAQVYDYVLDEVLAAHDWNFATKIYDLSQDATSPEGTDWDYRYALPSDCLRVIGILPAKTPYVIEAGYLLTNYDNTSASLTLHYIRRETNPAMYSPHFVNTLAFRLAAEMSFKQVRGSSNVQDRMFVLYEKFLLQAKGTNQSEDYLEDENNDGSWVEAGR